MTFLAFSAYRGSAITWLKGLYSSSHRLRRRHFLRRAKLTGLDDFNVANAGRSQTDAVVSNMALGYMFLSDKIKRMVRRK
jgi:hypothetical protein